MVRKERQVMRVNIVINNSSGKPIYEQIFQQIKQLILNGGLKPGDALPSMRYLAKELRISVITTKRAYEDLERDGFIHTVVGKGSFVAETNEELLREGSYRDIEDDLERAVEKAKSYGVSLEELMERLELLYRG